MLVKDYLLSEVDSSCALCGSRKALTEHHIDWNRENNDYSNRIVICDKCHVKVNKRNISDDEVGDRKRILVIKTLTQYGVNLLTICYRNSFGVIAMPFLVYHLVDLGFLVQKEVESTYGSEEEETLIHARYEITDKGKKLYDTWVR